MSAFFTYIFKHQHYKDVITDYNEAITKVEGKKGTLYLDSGNYFEIR